MHASWSYDLRSYNGVFVGFFAIDHLVKGRESVTPSFRSSSVVKSPPLHPAQNVFYNSSHERARYWVTGSFEAVQTRGAVKNDARWLGVKCCGNCETLKFKPRVSFFPLDVSVSLSYMRFVASTYSAFYLHRPNSLVVCNVPFAIYRKVVWSLLSLYHNCDSTTIRRYHDAFDYDGSSDRNYDMRSIRLRNDYDTTTTKNWHVHFFDRVESRRMKAGARDTS